MSIELTPSLKLFKIIGDETRLKIILILSRGEFTVGELVRILGIHQSNISRHLQQLRDGLLVDDRREGALVYYRWSEALRASAEIRNILRSAWETLPDTEAVIGHLEEILAQRRSRAQQFFDSVAGKYRKLAEPGGGAEPLLRALGSLLNYRHAVDVGAGEGDISLLLARGCRQVTALDINQKMLDYMRERCTSEGIHHIDILEGDAEHIPLPDHSADLIILSQVLHHTPNPERALAEMKRVLETGGRYIVLDLLAHNQDWVRDRLGDLWLGFDPERLAHLLTQLGCPPTTQEIIYVHEGLPAILLSGKIA